MRPTEQGGVLLEGEDMSFAVNTLSAAMLNVGARVSTRVGHEIFKDLAIKIGDSMRGGVQTLDLNGDETGSLRDACKVAEADTHFSLGVLTCFQSMTDLPKTLAIEAARGSTNPLLQSAALIAEIGPASMHLSGLLELYGGQEPTI